MSFFRTVIFTVIGLAVALLATLFTASIVIAFASIATVLLAARAMSLHLQPAQRRAYVRAQASRDTPRQPLRIWNDGKGTIVDM
jgi:hypothetical protein